MSASQDKSQKFKYLHSNLYQIHGKEDPTPKETAASKYASSSRVIKAEDVNSAPVAVQQKQSYVASEVAGKRVLRPGVISGAQSQSLALEGLKQNLKTLNDLHSRLRFMLEELEDLIKE
jgi:hypothetical protein